MFAVDKHLRARINPIKPGFHNLLVIFEWGAPFTLKPISPSCTWNSSVVNFRTKDCEIEYF